MSDRSVSGEAGAHPFAADAGAYVLGALDADERAAFEAHLPTCGACRAAVEEVAHLPSLLAAVPPEGLADPPPSVLTGLLAEVAGAEGGGRGAVRDIGGRRVRRGLWTGAGLVSAAAAGFLAAALVLPGGMAGEEGTAAEVTTVALAARTHAPVSASVDLEPAAWGTRIVVTCTYDAGGEDRYGGPGSAPVAYALVVRDADGRAEQVATWSAVPGRDLTVPAATALTLGEIADLEMVSGGEVVLAASL